MQEAKAKKRKRRLLQVGMSPEEKAYRQVRELLSGVVNSLRSEEQVEMADLNVLTQTFEHLKRDKNNCLNSLDEARKQLSKYLMME